MLTSDQNRTRVRSHHQTKTPPPWGGFFVWCSPSAGIGPAGRGTSLGFRRAPLAAGRVASRLQARRPGDSCRPTTPKKIPPHGRHFFLHLASATSRSQHPPQLPSVHQHLQILGATHKHPINKHHRKGRPPRPHLQRITPAPLVKVAAIFQVLEIELLISQQLPGLLDAGITHHTDHHNTMPRNRRLHFLHGIPEMFRHGLPDCWVDVLFIQYLSCHTYPLKKFTKTNSCADSNDLRKSLYCRRVRHLESLGIIQLPSRLTNNALAYGDNPLYCLPTPEHDPDVK